MRTHIDTKGDKTIFNIKFHNLVDLYDYLKKNPEINHKIFSEPASMKSGEFYGEPLDKAIEYIIGGYSEGLKNFLQTSDDLKRIGKQDEFSYRTVRSLHGGRPLAPLVAAGVNDCMLSNRTNDEVNVVTIYYQLGYSAGTSTSEIVNRGLASLYIIQALEAKGYLVNFKAFELSKEYDEVVHISIDLKRPGDLFLNVEKCYYPMKGKEFLRRVLFRVLESVDVTNRGWGDGYGRSLDPSEIAEFFQAKKNDLIIGAPRDMDIEGNNIYEDTINLIEALKIESEFDMQKLRRKV